MTVDIDQMETSRELDLRIAKMMGWWWDDESAYSPAGSRCSRKHGDSFWWLPCYSTNMETAWGIVRILTRKGYTLRLVGPEVPDTTGYLIEKRWSAAFVEPQYAFTDVGQSQGRGSTPSLAICRAALKVMEYEEESTEIDCQHEFFKCQVPAGDSCVAIYHKVCKLCRWDETKGVFMPLDIWQGWALRQLRDCNGDEDLSERQE